MGGIRETDEGPYFVDPSALPAGGFLIGSAGFVGCIQPRDVPSAHASRKLNWSGYLASFDEAVNSNSTAAISLCDLFGI